jgi:nitrogen fixation/metabolism regulation signal transduction histidine kinase
LFVLNLVAAVALLIVTMMTGKRRKKLLHMRVAVVTVVVLLLAVVQADLYGHGFTFVDWELKVHLVFAIGCLLAIPPVIYSGYRLRRASRWRKIHARFVTLFVVLTVLAVLTACYMFLHAEPLPETV